MRTEELTCIRCPIGCQITVELSDSNEVVKITGNSCPRGAEYAASEVTAPVRTVTSTVRVEGGVLPVVPVKTKGDIPKGRMAECMKEINALRVSAPVELGQVLIPHVLGLEADVVATRSVARA